MDERRQVDDALAARLVRQGQFADSVTPPAFESGPRREGDGPRNPWRRVAWLVLVVGVVASVAWFVVALTGQANHVNSFVGVPTTVGDTVEIDDAGLYTVWASKTDGSALEYRPQTSLSFEGPVDGADPARVDLVQAQSTTTYRIDMRREGLAVGTVAFPESGTYALVELEVGFTDVDLSLGEGVGMPFPMLRPILIIGAVAAAFFVVVLVLAWRRGRRDAAQATLAATSG